MPSGVDRPTLTALASEHWGMITTRQATAAGITKMTLSRMAQSGELERITHGVYAVPTAAEGEDLNERALLLAIAPELSAEQRL